MNFSRAIFPALFTVSLVAVAACGGGGGGGTTPPVSPPSGGATSPPPPPPPPQSVSTAPPNATALSSTIVTYAGAVIGGDNDFTPNDADTPSGGQGPLNSVFDSIPCQSTMPDNPYSAGSGHRHAWLGILVQGKQVAIPDAIGMVGDTGDDSSGFTNYATCFYYIHTHDASGYIHMEPDAGEQYALKDFFAIWGQSLVGGSNGEVTSQFKGTVRVFTATAPNNNNPVTTGWTEYTGDPNTIPLATHQAIFLEVGPPFVEAAQLPSVQFYTEF